MGSSTSVKIPLTDHANPVYTDNFTPGMLVRVDREPSNPIDAWEIVPGSGKDDNSRDWPKQFLSNKDILVFVRLATDLDLYDAGYTWIGVDKNRGSACVCLAGNERLCLVNWWHLIPVTTAE